MRWRQNISYFTTAKPSVHVWNHDLIWWQNKIVTQKHLHMTTITSPKNLRKTKIPITIVKAQMPSNSNQKSRTRDNELILQISCNIFLASDDIRPKYITLYDS